MSVCLTAEMSRTREVGEVWFFAGGRLPLGLRAFFFTALWGSKPQHRDFDILEYYTVKSQIELNNGKTMEKSRQNRDKIMVRF